MHNPGVETAHLDGALPLHGAGPPVASMTTDAPASRTLFVVDFAEQTHLADLEEFFRGDFHSFVDVLFSA